MPDPQAVHDRAGGGRQAAAREIHAEIESSVWEVLVEPGAQVAAGDTRVVLESMRSEIPVRTEPAGTVQELHVVEREVLQEGDLIATVGPG